MSASEQEVKSQIAEMRQSLQSLRAAARTATTVRVVAVLLGVAVVVSFVWAFVQLGSGVLRSGEIQQLALERVKQLNLEQVGPTVFREAAPVYAKQALDAVQQMDVLPKLQDELGMLYEDVRPMLMAEVERVAPRVGQILESQAQQTADDLEATLQKALSDRLTEMVTENLGAVQAEAGMAEEDFQVVLGNVVGANRDAFLAVVEGRWAEHRAKLDEIAEVVAQVPPAEPMSEEELLDEIRIVLISLLKERLPGYEELSNPATEE